jgi:dolichol-phosphate mannosyltransferase
LPELSIVIPAFNEVENVQIVVDDTVRALEAAGDVPSWQLVLIDDGSTDGTGAKMDALAARDPRVVAVHHAERRGFGAALRTGYQTAAGNYVTLLSADGEITADQALRLWRGIGPADLIISRRIRPAQLSRTLFTAVFGTLTRVITGFEPADMSGIYVIRREMLRALPLHSTTGVLNYEVVMRSAARGAAIRNGLTEVKPRLSGQSKVTNLATMIKATWELLKLRLPRRRA